MSEEVKGFVVVELEEIMRLQQRRREINAYRIDEIIIIDPDGNKVEMDDEFIDHWRMSGLSITDLELALVDENDVMRKRLTNDEVWKKK